MAAHDSEPVKKEATETEAAPPDIQSQIQVAMRSRVLHFKEQADSLTFEGVRRLLEKDLGLEKYALDVHKRFVKQCLSECLDEAADDNACKDSGETGGKQSQAVQEKVAESCGGPDLKNALGETCSNDEQKMENSTVTGLLTGQKAAKRENEEIPANRNKEETSEGSIKKALWKRASYIKANSDKVTMEGLRRLLEEDLKLNTYTLDPFKKFISKQLDEVLKSSEVSAPKRKIPKKSSLAKAAKQVSSEESSDSSDKESDEEDEDEVRPRKKIGSKQKMLNSEGSKKRKRPEKETKASAKRQIKAETVAEDNSDAENGANASEDSPSQSSAEKPAKKKESPTQVYGKRVEHLKSVIKSCGMSVPPSVYKKVKQVSENKREAQLIKELEDILSREGLSSKPSEKEIKEVRKRKERAKELEGIDTSNIVLSSRRRSTASYAPPPKPKVPDESDSDDADEDDGEDDEEDDVNDDEDGDIDNDGDGESEESDEDNNEDSD